MLAGSDELWLLPFTPSITELFFFFFLSSQSSIERREEEKERARRRRCSAALHRRPFTAGSAGRAKELAPSFAFSFLFLLTLHALERKVVPAAEKQQQQAELALLDTASASTDTSAN